MTDLERRQLFDCRREAVWFPTNSLIDVLNRTTETVNDPNKRVPSWDLSILEAVSDELGWRDSEDAW